MAAQSQVLQARLHLLSELRAGSPPPGAPISVKNTAAALKLSHTPVREALARLAGEGAVIVASERNGFSVPAIGYSSYRQRIGLLRLLLVGVIDVISSIREPAPHVDLGVEVADSLAAIESTIARIIGDHDNAEVARTIGRIGTVLAPYRRVEPSVMPDWAGKLTRLRARIAARDGATAIRSYCDTRLEHTNAIVDTLLYPDLGAAAVTLPSLSSARGRPSGADGSASSSTTGSPSRRRSARRDADRARFIGSAVLDAFIEPEPLDQPIEFLLADPIVANNGHRHRRGAATRTTAGRSVTPRVPHEWTAG